MIAQISVLIPTRNRPDGLQKALESVYEQTRLPYEVIVVDDASEPAVESGIFNGAPKGISTVLIRNQKARGGSGARNCGISAASGEWIAFLDDDDEFGKTKIEDVLAEMKENEEMDVIYHPARINMVREGVTYLSNPTDYCLYAEPFRAMLRKNGVGGTSMVVARVRHLRAVGGFGEEMPSLQDFDLWLRLAKAGARFHFLDKALTEYNYVTKEKSVSKGIDSNTRALELIESKHLDAYKALSRDEQRYYEIWKQSMKVQKALLNGERIGALRAQMWLVRAYPSLRQVAALAAVAAGPRFVYRLRALLS